ncbi:MAG: DUF6660 family protein [Chitinophagaceae bacterium]
MKVCSYILMIYLVFLSVVPCCAFDDCDDTIAATEQKGKEKDDCGGCSPVFNCEKCAAITIHVETASLAVIEIPVNPTYAEFIPSHIAPVYYDVWQPPRLGYTS